MCEQGGWAAVSGSERISPYRLDQSWVEAYTTGFSQTSIFIPTPFSGRTNGAQWRQGESKFLACFFVAWTQRRLTECFPWTTVGPHPPKETLTFRKEFFWQKTSGSLPAGLNLFPPNVPTREHDFFSIFSHFHIENDVILRILWLKNGPKYPFVGGKHSGDAQGPCMSSVQLLSARRRTFEHCTSCCPPRCDDGSISISALFFSRSFKEDNQVVFCLAGKRLK